MNKEEDINGLVKNAAIASKSALEMGHYGAVVNLSARLASLHIAAEQLSALLTAWKWNRRPLDKP